MAESSRDERVGRDEITQLPGTARPPSAGSGSYRQRAAANPPPIQRRPPSIRIRKLPSTTAIPRVNAPSGGDGGSDLESGATSRRRSSSAPMRPNLPAGLAAATEHLPALTEETSAPQPHTNAPPVSADGHLAPPAVPTGRLRSGSLRLRHIGSNLSARLAAAPPAPNDEYESEIVDMLDVVGTWLCKGNRIEVQTYLGQILKCRQ
jgi:hypothetical protein